MISDVDVLKYIIYLRENNIRLYLDDKKIKYKAMDGTSNEFISEFREYIGKNKNQFIKVLKNINDGIELSSIQKSYILGMDTDCELGGTNCAYYIEYSINNIDTVRLEKIINELIFENEGLRCFFVDINKYVIFDTFDKYKIKKLDNNLDYTEIRNLIFNKKYSYYDWPLFDFYVHKDSNIDDRLYFIFNCIVLDAWSASNLIKKMFDRYFFDIYIKSVSTDYSIYKRKENLYLDNLETEEYHKYLSDGMKKYSIPELKYKRDFSEIKKVTFKRVDYEFTVNETKEIFSKLKLLGYTPTMYIAACYARFLAEASGKESSSIILTINGRKNIIENENDIIGEFSNIAVLNYKKSGNFCDDLKNIRNSILEILEFIEHDGMESFKYIKQNKLGQIASPLVLTSVIEEDTTMERFVTENYSISKTPQVIIDHHIRLIRNSMVISWDYVEELFEKEYIETLFNDYIKLLHNMKLNIL